MKTTNIYVIKLKKNFLPMLFLFFTFCLLIFSKNNLVAVKNGLSLWANSVVPSLFPFFVATELLSHTNIINQLGNIYEIILDKKLVPANFRKKNICSKEECERLLSFTNNSGPLFIIGTVGISMFGNTIIGILLFVTHLLASITVGFIFRFWKYKSKTLNSQNNVKSNVMTISFANLGEVLAQSITSSLSTIFMIGGFVVIFSSIISILNSSGIQNIALLIFSPLFNFLNIDQSFICGLFTGFFEITNGISLISKIHIKKISINIIFTAFLLGFGGISVMLQVLSIISKTDLSCKPYILGKILHGTIAAFYTYLFVTFIPMLNLDLS